MKIMLNESLDSSDMNIFTKSGVSIKESSQVQTYIDDESIMVDIEGIHSIMTRNNTFYTADCLKESVPGWTYPYERPVIMHHNEKDGKIIGRIKACKYIQSERSKSAALEFTVNIGDEKGKKGIENGTLSTVSIGAFSEDIRCSICGTNIAEEGLCEHERGNIYDGQICYWIINKIEPKELSFVIVPSDIYAHTTKVYPVKNKNNKEVKEMNDMFYNILEVKDDSSSLSKSTKKETEGNLTQKTIVESTSTDTEKEVKEDAILGEEIKCGHDTKIEKGQKEDSENKKLEELFSKTKKDASCSSDNEEDDCNDKDDKKDKDDCDDEDNLDEADLKAIVKELQLKVDKLEKLNAKLTKAVASERKLKESAELELVQLKNERKIAVAEQINATRKSIGLTEQSIEELCTHSLKDLNSSLKTYNECKEATLNSLRSMTVASPVAVSESADNTNVASEKTTKTKNLKEEVDFQKRLNSIFEM